MQVVVGIDGLPNSAWQQDHSSWSPNWHHHDHQSEPHAMTDVLGQSTDVTHALAHINYIFD